MGAALQAVGTRQPKQLSDKRPQIARPAYGHESAADAPLQDKRPTDRKGHQLAHGGVSVGIGAARDGNHGAHFGVAQSGEGGGNTGNSKGNAHCGASMNGGGLPGYDENTGAQNDAHAKNNQVKCAKSATQTYIGLSLSGQICHGLASQQLFYKTHIFISRSGMLHPYLALALAVNWCLTRGASPHLFVNV